MKDISFREEKRRDFSFQGKAAINIDTLFIKSDFHRTIKEKKNQRLFVFFKNFMSTKK